MTPSHDQPLDLAAILNHRSLPDRNRADLAAAQVVQKLLVGARVLQQLEEQPVLGASIGVSLLRDLAVHLGKDLSPTELRSLWTVEHRTATAEAVAVFRSVFSLNADVLEGFRETHPDLLYCYLLFRSLFFGRLPVVASDLKDTLAEFVVSAAGEEPGSKGGYSIPAYRGVREAIDEALTVGDFFVVTGDTHEVVVQNFVCANGWAVLGTQGLQPARDSCRGLRWLPRTGMELVECQGESFLRSQLIPGVPAVELPRIRALLRAVYEELQVPGHFTAPGRCYEFKAGAPPATIEERPSASGEDFSVAFYPAGILTKSARDRFKSDPSNAPLLEKITCRVNDELRKLRLSHIRAKRGGLSTIDLVTSDKGDALKEIRRRYLGRSETLVFLGDRIALNGNDVEAIQEADISVQVGNEWDHQLFPGGQRTLLWSRASAREGGAADFIRDATLVRRLGLTGALCAEASASLEGRLPSVVPFLQPVPNPRAALQEARELKTQILQRAIRPASPEIVELARRLSGVVAELPSDPQTYDLSPFDQLETLLLKRVIAGRQPVLASDLKDTIAVFDANGVEWFPETEEAFTQALRNGPYFLITGDSLRNLESQFLLPARVVEHRDGHLQSSFPGIHNLHLITRTGLDRVIFDFSAGKLVRSPLVHGIGHRQVDDIREILEHTTRSYECAADFAEFRSEPSRPPGYIDVRGEEFPGDSISFAYFPAGVLCKEERPRFRESRMGDERFRNMIAFIRSELRKRNYENVLAQQGGISTIDLTTATKGTALAHLRRQVLGPHEFLVYLGDTITQRGNDGSVVGIAEITVQVGKERDTTLAPPPGYHHIHSDVHARSGGAARAMRLVVDARQLFALGLWTPASQPPIH